MPPTMPLFDLFKIPLNSFYFHRFPEYLYFEYLYPDFLKIIHIIKIEYYVKIGLYNYLTNRLFVPPYLRNL
jgi:hypothetical protein